MARDSVTGLRPRNTWSRNVKPCRVEPAHRPPWQRSSPHSAGPEHRLARPARSTGRRVRTFFKVIVPLILPGVTSGGLFAFITSFDEVVVVLFLAGFEQRTIPRQMWAGIREQISPTILAVATLLVVVSIVLLTTLELLRRRNERLRGIRV